MLDIRFVREHRELVEDAISKKNIELDLSRFLELDESRRNLLKEYEELKAVQNRASDNIASAKGEEKAAMISEMKEIANRVHAAKDALQNVDDEYKNLLLRIPQIPHPSAPVGGEEANTVVREVGEKPDFDFAPKDHIELGFMHDLIDVERGVKLMGTRGFVLKNEAAQLETALQQYALSFLRQRGFTQLNVPVLAKERFFQGSGHFPFAEAETFRVFDQKTDREEPPFYLIGTSEVPLCGYHADEVLESGHLPRLYCAATACFRTEVGSYGKDAHGLYRVKQFQKVEQVVIMKADEEAGLDMLEQLVKNAEDFLSSLELPYRVLRIATGDMGAGKVSMYDIETWMPSRNSYGETHSASYLGDWQARRLNIRYKDGDEMKVCHTLNNTLVATPRILIPLLENHQRKDGSIYIPQALRPYMDGKESINNQ